MIRKEYTTENERVLYLEEYTDKGYLLYGEENIIEGNFLIFALPSEIPKPTIPEPTEIELLKQENQSLQQQVTLINSDFQSFMDFYFSQL